MGSIVFEGHVPVSHERLLENIKHSRSLGLPYAQVVEPHGRRLAVVGGGPSIVNQLDEIKTYSDIWAINGACRFLRENGIESTLLTLDPCDFLAPRVSGATKAIICSRCDPSVFESLKGCDITLFDVIQDAAPEGRYGIWASVSTASSVFQLATDYGFRDTTFYGCEGSYSELTHAYMNEQELQDYRFVVSCGGKEYLTAPDLYQQVNAMLPVMKMFKNHFHERSGGLLGAMIENEQHDIVKVSKTLMSSLKPIIRCPRCGSRWHTDCFDSNTKGEAA